MDWEVYRVVMVSRFSVTPRDIYEGWTQDELDQANLAIDFSEDLGMLG